MAEDKNEQIVSEAPEGVAEVADAPKKGAVKSEPMQKAGDFEDLGPAVTSPSDKAGQDKADDKMKKDGTAPTKGSAPAEPMQKLKASKHDKMKAEAMNGDDEDEKEESKKESYDMSDDIDALVGGEDLSEEFKNKAKVVFEAAVSAKVSEIKEDLESQKRDEIVEASNEIKEELVNKVDSFLGYVAEEWVKDNELAIERGLKSELTENFIQGLKALFEDHYVEVPDDKLDVVDELALTTLLIKLPVALFVEVVNFCPFIFISARPVFVLPLLW